MKRVLLGFVAAAALFFAVRVVVRALASDETRIRWRIAAMVDGFNRERAAPVLKGFDKDYRDASSNADRELVHRGVVSLFFREVDPETGRFLLRAEVPDDTLAVEVGEDRRSATATGVLTVFRREGEGESVLWRASFEGQLARGDEGWRFVRSNHATLDGDRPR